MKIDVVFHENEGSFDADFGEVQNISDGGYERGYAAGYEKGYSDNKDWLPDVMHDTLVEYASDSVVSVRKYGFAEMKSMVRISLPNCTYLDSSSFQLNSFTEGHLPKVEFVGSNAFSWCKFERIKMPLKTAMTRAFYYCSNLNAVIISQREIVCSLEDTLVFKGTPIEKGTGYVYVPKTMADGSDGVAAYKAAANWSTYANQIRAIEDYPEICGDAT